MLGFSLSKTLGASPAIPEVEMLLQLLLWKVLFEIFDPWYAIWLVFDAEAWAVIELVAWFWYLVVGLVFPGYEYALAS